MSESTLKANESSGGTGGVPDREPLKLFISYSSKDRVHRETLSTFLAPLVRQGVLEVWHDRMIEPGEEWDALIATKLNEADLIMLLVSADFLNSDYCYENEMKSALARHDAGTARVIPIILKTCLWKNEPFARLEVLPLKGKPVTSHGKREEAWTFIASKIAELANKHLNINTSNSGRVRSAAPARVVAPPANPERYLAALKEQHSYLDVRGIGAQVAERMELGQVYTRLSVSAPRTPDVPSAADSRRELREVLADTPHAAIVGDPGSGKTTFLRYVAQNLARAHLGDADALARVGLTGKPPFPIFVRLSQLARFLIDHPDTDIADDAPEHFYRYLDFSLAGQSYELPQDYLRLRARAGGCLLLLDGLDEVPGDAMRERMARLIGQLMVSGKAANRHLITCRTRAYEGNVQLAGDVATLRLADLERPQVEQFAESWSRALFRADSLDAGSTRGEEAAKYRDTLLAAIDENPSGETFSTNPLMLTVVAVVHWNQKRLPEQRAELYEAAVNYLLESRREHSPHPATLRRECLQAVAISMFEDSDGVQRSLGRTDAAKAVRRVLPMSQTDALDFLENEELHSGVLVSRTEGEVEFWHLTFQEYLAALELSQAEDGWTRVAQHLYDDRWAEVILLLAGCERRQGGVRAARRLIGRVLATGGSDMVSTARAVGLVGRILHDIRAYGGEPEQATNYARDLAKVLSIFEPGGDAVSEAIRVEVGEALGQAGDPRLDDPAANRVAIPGGSFWMGAQTKNPAGEGYEPEAYPAESPVHRATVASFHIGRYPVTVAEYRKFVEAGARGYLDARYWDAKGWSWRLGAGRATPFEWSQQLAHPNRPVTGVTWYEADAYCRWVGGRLPTETEWEWVARGAEGRRYPWGSETPSDRHTNFDSRWKSAVPVGIYPGDANEHGVRDLAGNIYEWCADEWTDEYRVSAAEEGKAAATTAPADKERKECVLRGVSFRDSAGGLRSARRNRFGILGESDFVGLRVAWP